MKEYRSVLGGFLALLLCFACSKGTDTNASVVQDRIHQSYTVSYDGRNDTTSAFAQFRVGDATGTTLELVGSSGVTHNHFSLFKDGSLGTSYQGSVNGFIPEATFIYKDANGATYVNSAKLLIIRFWEPPTVISRTRGAEVHWWGGPRSPGETVVLDFLPVPSTGSIGNVSVPTGTDFVRLTPDVLASSLPGTYRMCLTRSITLPLKQATSAGGELTIRYTTAYFNFQLID